MLQKLGEEHLIERRNKKMFGRLGVPSDKEDRIGSLSSRQAKNLRQVMATIKTIFSATTTNMRMTEMTKYLMEVAKQNNITNLTFNEIRDTYITRASTGKKTFVVNFHLSCAHEMKIYSSLVHMRGYVFLMQWIILSLTVTEIDKDFRARMEKKTSGQKPEKRKRGRPSSKAGVPKPKKSKSFATGKILHMKFSSYKTHSILILLV
jgi:hypothetical protein